MEGSTQYSSMNKSPSCSKGGGGGGGGATPSEEESGWTSYFEDFMVSEEEGTTSRCSSCTSGCPSLVSDAASCAVAWKAGGSEAVCVPVAESFRKLRFKRRKTRGFVDDDSLEDTASSPVSSHKVRDLELDVNSMKKNGSKEISQAKAFGSGNHLELRRNEMDGLEFTERANESIELKERGLCLVPLSMLVNYIG